MKNNRNKKLSKRAKLVIANVAVLVLVLIVALVQLTVFGSIDLVTYLTVIIIFVLLSLMVYYISIIADTLSERNRALQDRTPKETGHGNKDK